LARGAAHVVHAREIASLSDVLAAVRRGRVAYLCLTREQKRALRDRDGQLALDVLRHLLGARADRRDPERFPLTEGAFQAVAHRLGLGVGQKRARGLIRRLSAAAVIVSSGQYRQPYRNAATRSDFKVPLYRLSRRAQALRRSRRRQAKRPVGTAAPVKARFVLRWWQHPLFGDVCGLPPPEIPRRRDEGCAEAETEAALLGPWGCCFERQVSSLSSCSTVRRARAEAEPASRGASTTGLGRRPAASVPRRTRPFASRRHRRTSTAATSPTATSPCAGTSPTRIRITLTATATGSARRPSGR